MFDTVVVSPQEVVGVTESARDLDSNVESLLEIRFVLPVSASSGWWDVRVGGIGGSLGMVVRF